MSDLPRPEICTVVDTLVSYLCARADGATHIQKMRRDDLEWHLQNAIDLAPRKRYAWWRSITRRMSYVLDRVLQTSRRRSKS